MDDTPSFGYWIRRRRKALDLTQEVLAQQVGCSLGAIRKLEADERRPSPEMAVRLADVLEVVDDERQSFLKVARAERAADQLIGPTESVVLSPRSSRLGYSVFPGAATPLIGRDAEVATLSAALEQPSVRLLTLTGPGGTGKTRLALAVASAMVDDFADGAAFVDLAPIHEPDLVLVTIAAALGLAEQREQPLLVTLQEALRAKQSLLVLDNFEQVVSAAPLLADLLRSAPGITLLVTSRIVLGLSGEHVVAVPPLEVPAPLDHRSASTSLAQFLEVAAVRLFVDRAMAATSTFVVTEANAHVVANICRRLDGLPLAIELAAARTRILSLPALLQRLGQRLPVLTGGARDLPARQQTLRATIDWSYELLPPREQRLFWRLAVFVGGWTLEAAEALTGDEDTGAMEVVDQLQSLLDNSLILKTEESDGMPRFRLYETIREYALERLKASGEALAVQEWHTAYFLRLAETAAPHLITAERDRWLEELEQEHDNLRAALAWTETQPAQAETMLRLAAALSQFWWWHVGEGVDWIHRALRRTEGPAMDGQSPAPALMRLRARVLFEAWFLANHWGDQRQDTDVNESIALYEALGDPLDPGFAAVLMAAGHATQDAETSIALWERSVAMYRALGDDVNASDVLGNLGHLARRQGKYAQSEAFYTEALELTQTTRGEPVRARLLEQLGALALHQQAPSRAVSMLEESVRLLRGRPGPEGAISLAWALIHLAEARRVVGEMLEGVGSASDDQESLRRLCEEGLLLHRAWEARVSLGFALLEIGELEYELGDDARAASHLRESVVALRDLAHAQHMGRTLDAMGALVAVGSHPDALACAVRLWSAATKLHQNRPRLSPVRRARYERTFGAARTKLDEGQYAAAWAEGQAMTLEQAVAYALELSNPE